MRVFRCDRCHFAMDERASGWSELMRTGRCPHCGHDHSGLPDWASSHIAIEGPLRGVRLQGKPAVFQRSLSITILRVGAGLNLVAGVGIAVFLRFD